jgi:glycosyltransferase involved in cell wall biosynthesis
MISVIIPIHNAGKTLERCIDSVVNQTYTDLEILCIENGSSDNSWLLIQKYEKIDNRVKGYTLINVSSVSKARNKGLSEARGEYITFLDSDDWFENNYLETMLTSMKESGVDLVASKWVQYPSMKIIGYDADCITNRNKRYWNYALMNMVWGKLYKASLVKHIEFDNVKIGEDAIFILKVVLQCQRIQFLSIPGYYYLNNEESVTSKLTTSPEYISELFRYPKIGLMYLKHVSAKSDTINAWAYSCYMTIFNCSVRIKSNEIWDLWVNEMSILMKILPPNSYLFKVLEIAHVKINNQKFIYLYYKYSLIKNRHINRICKFFCLR